ncbi:carbohydrate ABC transporter permease [Ruegeria hyattellae]|uniref:carbohydrate ABC transporter permease n=1 Tax=Ruegeria hyattellae TaxID=3233337 RepID=UPI00355C7D44
MLTIKAQKRLGGFIRHSWLMLSVFAILFPFLWIALSGFKREIDIAMSRISFAPVWSNYEELLFSKSSTYLTNFLNSVIVSFSATVLCVGIATLAAHSLRRHKWPIFAVSAILIFSMIFNMTPAMTLVGAWHSLFVKVGINNTLFALILVNVVLLLPMALWLMMTFMRDVPEELEEAAAIDGCTPAEIFRKIVLPLVVPGMMATSVIVFVFSWNEFQAALTLTTKATQTVPVAIAKFAQEYEVKHGAMAAAATLSTIPAVMLMLVATRYIVSGLTNGAIK